MEEIESMPDGANILDINPQQALQDDVIKDFFYKSMIRTFMVYDAQGKVRCHSLKSDRLDFVCSYNVLDSLKKTSLDKLFTKTCSADTELHVKSNYRDLDSLMLQLKYQAVPFKTYRHTVISFWNTDFINWDFTKEWRDFEDSFSNSENVLFIRVWTNLNEKWGLKKNGTAKIIMKKVPGEKKAYEAYIKNLPYKKHIPTTTIN
ncbi:MAG: hypothetical protein WBG71_01815 [Leeuwenhoekiella sp.]